MAVVLTPPGALVPVTVIMVLGDSLHTSSWVSAMGAGVVAGG